MLLEERRDKNPSSSSAPAQEPGNVRRHQHLLSGSDFSLLSPRKKGFSGVFVER